VLTLLRVAKALDIPSAWLLTRRNLNASLPPRGTQDGAATSTTTFVTSDDRAALLSLLGATIRQYRHQHHLTQQALAAKTELTPSYIGQVERGVRNVTILNLIRIAEALELSVDHLLAVLDAYQSSAPIPSERV
jgi:DNA-binding XRE family transcriptional regulator